MTRSPATIPSPTAASVDRGLAREHAGAHPQAVDPGLLAERLHRCDEVERRANGPLGVVLRRHRRPPHRHHRVADELLDHAAVQPDEPPARVEVAGEELAHLLGVARLGEGREADQVGEEHRDEPAFRDRSLDRGDRGLPAHAAASAVPQSPQKRSPGSYGALQEGT